MKSKESDKKQRISNLIGLREIVITGPTGAGKSRLAKRVFNSHGTTFIDPLASAGINEWIAPDPSTCKAVVMDHIYFFKNPIQTINDAKEWCASHRIPLCYVEEPTIFQDRIIELSRDAFVLNLLTDEGKQVTVFSPIGEQVSLGFDEALTVLLQMRY